MAHTVIRVLIKAFRVTLKKIHDPPPKKIRTLIRSTEVRNISYLKKFKGIFRNKSYKNMEKNSVRHKRDTHFSCLSFKTNFEVVIPIKDADLVEKIYKIQQKICGKTPWLKDAAKPRDKFHVSICFLSLKTGDEIKR